MKVLLKDRVHKAQ